MNPEQFEQLRDVLALGPNADAADAVDKVQTLVAVVTSLGDGDEESRAALLAASSQLSRITGETTMAGAVLVVEQWSKDRLANEAALAQERDARQALEMAEYRKLTASLVKVGAEIPATAWADDKGTMPVDRILAEPLSSLRQRVARLTAANGGQRIVATRDSLDLTKAELEQCEANGVDPAAYAKTKQRIRARSQRTGTEG